MSATGGGDGAGELTWTDEVDDRVDAGDVEGAVALLESVVARLETSTPAAGSDLRLAAALGDLAGLQNARGLSLKADELRSRALALRSSASAAAALTTVDNRASEIANEEEMISPGISNISKVEVEEDDWEALADRAVDDKFLSLKQEKVEESCSSPKTSLSSKQEKIEESCSSSKTYTSPSATKRRGRGSFLYGKSVLYCDQSESGSIEGDNVTEQDALDFREEVPYKEAVGTRHVLVLYDFSPSIRTIDLERIFEEFDDRAFAIRWVNDTVALAVFRSPAKANDAKNLIPSTYKVRMLKEDDELLSQIDNRDLEVPRLRPKTSAVAAQRMIAHGMGLKPFSNTGIREHKKQEEARRSRIIARQNMRDDAWGADD